MTQSHQSANPFELCDHTERRRRSPVVGADGEDVPVVGGAVDDGAWDVLVEGDGTMVVADDTGSESLSAGRRAPPMIMTTKEPATTKPACFLVSTRSRPNGRTRLTRPNKNPANPTRISSPPIGSEPTGEADEVPYGAGQKLSHPWSRTVGVPLAHPTSITTTNNYSDPCVAIAFATSRPGEPLTEFKHRR